MAILAVATTMAIIFLRTATNGVRSSLYVVYLKGRRADRDGDRHPVRRDRDYQRVGLAVGRAGDAVR